MSLQNLSLPNRITDPKYFLSNRIDAPNRTLRATIPLSTALFEIKSILSLEKTDLNSLNRIEFLINNLSFQHPSSLQDLATLLQRVPAAQALWFRYIFSHLQTVITKHQGHFANSNTTLHPRVQDKIESYLKLIDVHALKSYAKLTISEGKISRDVLVTLNKNNLAIVALLEADPVAIHFHKPGIIETWLRFITKAKGTEYQARQLLPKSVPATPHYNVITHTLRRN